MTTSLTTRLFNQARAPRNSEWRRAIARRHIRHDVWLCRETGEVFGHTINVNPVALTVSVHEPFVPGVRVLVRDATAGGSPEHMQVVHCTRALGGFKVGLQQCGSGCKTDPTAALRALFDFTPRRNRPPTAG